ncbi:MAG: peptide chain release factor N(5)-glutamine methyltransferase [Burkholderiales bacterium]|nr:MAG: peptide chain release factor N(5)-glutamine methyltransferase [Burkholderiales bacterium]
MSHATWDALIAACALPRLDARALAEQASGRPRAWLIAHGDEPAEDAAARAFEALAGRRRAGEPLAYLLGWREFHGRRFDVGPGVLVPRPETEGLVEATLERVADVAAPRLLDLGTGSGAIAVTLALERPDAAVLATDASAEALAVARANAARLGAGRVAFAHGDWWAALAPDAPAFDAIVSNPPYIADADPHLLDPALRHEPPAALASGRDGLDAIDTIVAGAAARLVPGGWLLLEHGHDQGAAVRERLVRAGLDAVATRVDLQGLDRVSLGRRPFHAAQDRVD